MLYSVEMLFFGLAVAQPPPVPPAVLLRVDGRCHPVPRRPDRAAEPRPPPGCCVGRPGTITIRVRVRVGLPTVTP